MRRKKLERTLKAMQNLHELAMDYPEVFSYDFKKTLRDIIKGLLTLRQDNTIWKENHRKEK